MTESNPKTPDQESAHKSVTGLSLAHGHFTLVFFILISLFGLISFYQLPKDLLPAGNTTAIQIITFYPGMPVEHVEQELTFPLERYTGQSVGISHQESRSLTGVSVIRNYFHSGIDLSNALAQTSSLVMSVMRKLPPGTQPPLILPFDPMSAQPLAQLTVGGLGKNQAELQDVARYQITNRLQGVNGAVAPAVMGGTTRAAVVYLDPAKLKKYNLSAVSVIDLLNSMNSFVPSGEVNLGATNFQLQSNGLLEALPEIDQMNLRSQSGVSVKVGDVGHTEDATLPQTNLVTVDGRPEVYIPIYRQPGANALEVIDGVTGVIQEFAKTLPDLKLTLANDQSGFIRNSIQSIGIEGAIGGIFAALMILFFLGSPRATVGVLITIPIAVLAAGIALLAYHQSLNVMTLGGLALSIGVLVDNAIVVIEAIIQKQEDGHAPRKAALLGANTVAVPVLASTIVTLIIFIPTLFLEGNVRLLLASVSMTVSSTMIASYVAAMTIVPLFCARYLTVHSGPSKGALARTVAWSNGLTGAYRKSLDWVLSHSRSVAIFAVLAMVLAGTVAVPWIGTELFPRADAGSMRLLMRVPGGASVEATAGFMGQVESKLRQLIPAEDLKMIVGNAGVYYGISSAFSPNAGAQHAFLDIDLTEGRHHTTQYYAKNLRTQLKTDFPQIEFAFSLGGLMSSALNGGLPSPIEVEVAGPDFNKSMGLARDLKDQFSKIRGVADLRIQQRDDAKRIEIQIDRKLASNYGLTADVAVKNIVSAVSNSSTYNAAVWIDPKSHVDYPFGVEFAKGAIQKPSDLLNILLTSTDQERVISLGKIASLKKSDGPTEISHKNLQKTVSLFMDSEDRDLGGVATDANRIIEGMKFPTGFSANVRGEISEMNEAFSKFGGGFLLATILVYLILVVQFRSFVYPGIMLTTVPMGILGVVVFFALSGTRFSIQAAIGCIFVIGVAVSHGVLLVEGMLHELSTGRRDLRQVVTEVAGKRFRPILMTSLASIFGILPMALGFGHGAEVNIPLARAVLGGQIFSTLLNYYLVPCLFIAIKGYLDRRPEAPQLDTELAS